MPGSLVLTNTQRILVGVALAAINALQWALVDASTGVHTAVTIIIVSAGAIGVTSKDAAQAGTLLPHGLAVLATTVATIGTAVLGLSDIGQAAHAVIAGVVSFLATVGINPTSPVAPVPPNQR
jgi:hypothetical protein